MPFSITGNNPYNVTIYYLMVSRAIIDGRLSFRMLKGVTIERLLYIYGLLVLIRKYGPV